MSTWISRIKLHNFKSYENAEFKFPAPSSNGSNLILIGALNGHGKTTLLEAIYLCLYGNDGEKALERATVNSEDKSRPLQNALFINAQPANTRPKWYEGTYYIKLEMDIKWNTSKGTNGISIERTCFAYR